MPEPGPGEVLVKVGGAGACHSDLHVMEWPPGALPYELPFTLGHENAGWVEALGAGRRRPGGRRGGRRLRPLGLRPLPPLPPDARDPAASGAAELGAAGGGLGRDGGMAEYMLVPDARLLVPLGDLDPRDAAPLSDAALTPYHAIKLALPQLVPGTSAVVIGVGGLGHMAVQMLRALSPGPGHRHRHRPRQARARTRRRRRPHRRSPARTPRPRSASSPAVAAPRSSSTASAATPRSRSTPRWSHTGGAVMAIGVAGGTLAYPFNALPSDASLTHPYWGSIIELAEVLELARAGQSRAHAERFPLERVTDAYERMRNGTLSGRAVITPHG